MFDKDKVTADELGVAMRRRRTKLAAMLLADGRTAEEALLEAGRVFDYVAVTCLYAKLLEVPGLRSAVLQAVASLSLTLDTHDFKRGDPRTIGDDIKKETERHNKEVDRIKNGG